MGVDVSHDCWQGPYTAFHRWRTKIAEVAGYTDQWPDGLLIGNHEDSEDFLSGTWKKTPDDPILILLCHSDCDGEITVEHAKALADRLEGLLPKLRGGDYRQRTEQFIAGLRDAAAAGETVEFG